MAPSRRALLASGAAGLLAAGARGAARDDTALIVVYANGGWDTTYSFVAKTSPYVEGPEADPPDPDQPDDVEEVASFGEIQVAVNPVKRPAVATWFSRWWDRALVIDGAWAGGVAHVPNRRRVLSGSTTGLAPDVVAVLGNAADVGYPFGAVDLAGLCTPGPFASDVGRFGLRWQLGELLAPGEGLGAGLSADDEADRWLADHLRRRALALPPDPWIGDALRAFDRADALRPRRAELASLLAAGDSRQLASNLDLAADLILGGWCRAVLVDSQQYFDTHSNNVDQHLRTNALFTHLDGLMDRLDAGGALDRTLVVVASEMTRSPTRNLGAGKDHWPVLAYLLAGGGVVGGRSLGGTDDRAAPLAVDLATGRPDPAGAVARYDHVLAALFAQLGLDPDPWLPGVTPYGGITG